MAQFSLNNVHKRGLKHHHFFFLKLHIDLKMARNAIESEFGTCIQNGRRQLHVLCQKFQKN